MKLARLFSLGAISLLLMQPGQAPAQSKPQLSESDRSAIDLASRRGSQLIYYDQAAWHGTDDMIKKLPKYADIVGGYIVDGPIDRPEIIFFDRDQQHPHAVYVGRMENFKIVSSRVLAENERPELTPDRVALVRARSAAAAAMAQAQLRPCSSRPFNSVVLPPERPGGPMRVYFLSPQTTNDRVPFGGHFVVEVAADGTASRPRAFTNACLEQPSASFRTPEGGKPVTDFITHVLDPVPTEIHVFSAYAAKLPVHVNAVLPTSRVFLVTPKSIELLDKVPPMIQAQVDAALRAAQAENAARAASAAPPARAPDQPPTIAIAADASWTHAPSGIALPPAIGSFARGTVTDLSNGAMLDVMAQYRDPVSQSTATLYVFHAAVPSAGLWFDAAATMLKSNPAGAAASLGTVTAAGPMIGFPLRGGPVNSVLHQSFAISQRGRSTGLEVVAMGEWIVKLRMTSNMLEPAQLDLTMMRFMSQVGWPAQLPPMTAAIPVGPCSRPLPALARAEKIKVEGAEVMLNAMLGSVASIADEKLRKEGKAPTMPALCANPVKAGGNLPVYRSLANDNFYYIALGDSGRLLVADHVTEPGQLVKMKPYSRLTLITHNQWVQLPGYATLPPPDQVIEIFQKERPLTVTSTYGPNRNVQVAPDALK